MAAPKTTALKLGNRSPKTPIRGLPSSIEITPETTVEELKALVAKSVKLSDPSRIGVFDPNTKKTLKDRKARLYDVPCVAEGGEVLIKDLGIQVPWRWVFVIEYIGAIASHILVYFLRPYVYSYWGVTSNDDVSLTQTLSFAMIVGHFLKREYETLFVHKFSATTMPVFNVFKNSAYYWFPAGLFAAFQIYHPNSFAAKGDDLWQMNALGVALFLFGEITNGWIHMYQATLRATGGTERKIPVGHGFEIVTCPNYAVEILAWLGIILVSRAWMVALFISIGTVQMFFWAQAKERAYRKEFGDRYKKKRYLIFPGFF